jgi:hypothetical protein
MAACPFDGERGDIRWRQGQALDAPAARLARITVNLQLQRI